MLTEFDKKLLFELDKDGRASFTELATMLDTSPQVIKYHYQKLEDEGILRHFWAFIDYDKADYSVFWGYWLKFSGLTKEAETEMYADFKGNKYIPIVMRCDGYADVMLGIIGHDVFHHNQVLQGVFEKYGQYVAESDLAVGLSFHKFPRTYFIGGNNEIGEYKMSGGTTEKVKLSELDRKILSLLQVDGRMEFTKIAKKVGVTAGLVQKHYKKLWEKGVITKITYTPGYGEMGMTLYRVLFKIGQFNSKRVDELYQFCLKHPNIIHYVKSMGNWELMLDIEIEDRTKLRNVIRTMKQQFKDIITRVEINEVYKMDKFTQMAVEYPDLVLS